jgi:hypothetical protein
MAVNGTGDGNYRVRRSKQVTDLIGRTLNRLGQKLRGHLSMPGDDRYRLTTVIRAKRAAVLAAAAVATIVVVWSMSTFVNAKLAGKAETIEGSATIWPSEMMERHGRNLPGEYWADPF